MVKFNKYMTELFGFSQEVEGIEMDFKDKNIEENFKISNIQHDSIKSQIFLLISVISYIFCIIASLVVNKFLTRSAFIFLAALIFECVLYKIMRDSNFKFKVLSILRNIRFFILYLSAGLTIMFPVTLPDLNQCNQIGYIHFYLLFVNLIYLYYLEFNLILLILVPILNTGFILFFQFYYEYPSYNLLAELIVNLIYYVVTFLYKKYEFSNLKKKFFENYKNENFIEYIKHLINNLNTIVISVKNEEVLFINDFGTNYFKNKNKCNVREENKENEIFISHASIDQIEPPTLNNQMSAFFNSLILETGLLNEKILFRKGKSLGEIISEIFSDKNLTSKDFIRIGYFRTINEPTFFEIHVRKLKFREEFVEIFMNDITDIKIAEKMNTESKYKQKILAKIAHEFKTPLITITSLINKIMNQQSDVHLEQSTKISLNHIDNLSKYTIVLVSDIIQYVSDSIDLRLNKCEIYIGEVMKFGFNVLKTLVECNENKVNQIKVTMEIDENVDGMTIVTDENRLKQILLNFISNAVKFTISGFINIKANYIRRLNSIELCVKDSGLGIKTDDHHLIFKENVQLNVEKEYNSQGSGLGLSITKTLANNLDHEIGFISQYGEGSKFYLRMKCNNLNQDLIPRMMNTTRN